MAATGPYRTPSAFEKALIILLSLYAIAVILPDTFRALPLPRTAERSPLDWYPIATLGFEADNNGVVKSVDAEGPAARAGLAKGDVIDLESVKPDRRPINIFVYVAHGSEYTMRLLESQNGESEVTVTAQDEPMQGAYRRALVLTQCAALFFIGLCVYLVWRNATWATWGFFLYGMWFNSGQYFVWYANLSTFGLGVFDLLQVIAQSLALTGFLAFAMHFPEERLPQWTVSRRLTLLGAVLAVQLVTGASSFLNYVLAWHTERAYFVHYCFTFVVYLVGVGFFLYNYRRLPQHRPRMKWIVAAGIIGLPCFIFADLIEATSFGGHLPAAIDAWIDSHNWVLNLLYAMNVIMPAAVVYTALNHEVMSVRFGITRAVVLTGAFVVCGALLDLLVKAPLEHWMKERETLSAVMLPISFALAAGLSLIHNPLHGIVERVLAPRWHRAKRDLQAIARRLADDDALTGHDVDRALVRDAAQALWLECAALFRRGKDDVFRIQEQFNWPTRARRELRCDDPWARCVTSDPVPLTDPDEAPREPELAVPVQYGARHAVSRLVLYGHHDSGERIDPDEVRLLRELARAAAVAYMRLELEAATEAAASPAPGSESAAGRAA